MADEEDIGRLALELEDDRFKAVSHRPEQSVSSILRRKSSGGKRTER